MRKAASDAITRATRLRWRRCWPCPKPAQYLRQGLTVATLERIAAVRSDTEAAQQMQQAKRKLFEQLRSASPEK